MKKTILIVDDFANTRFVIEMTLKNAGYNVIGAESGKEALMYLADKKIDLIISDFNMPQMNGLEFIKKAKAMPQYRRTPVFILSTETDPDTKKKAFEEGITTWIKKPFKMEHFLKLIEKALR